MNFLAQLSDEAMYRKKCFNPVISNWPKDISRDEKVFLESKYKISLNWWLEINNISEWNEIRKPEPSLSIWTDASEYGWGAHSVDGDWRSGQWSRSERDFHINILEIKAVTEAIKAGLTGNHSSILIHTDNVTTLFAINKWGSSKSR